jgi:hypothetical protein
MDRMKMGLPATPKMSEGNEPSKSLTRRERFGENDTCPLDATEKVDLKVDQVSVRK